MRFKSRRSISRTPATHAIARAYLHRYHQQQYASHAITRADAIAVYYILS